jgi:enoyl-CoA hydratase/carnithine racemase
MNRPESHNALSRALLADMIAAIAAAPGQGARVLILAANGPSFCAGADLKERQTLNDGEKYAHNRQINALADALRSSSLCTIAAIGGAALGGGLEIALACDLRFASEGAVLGLTEARVGAIPGAGGTQRLPRLIGAARALEMMYSGEPIGAAKALDWGLVNHVVPADALDERVRAFAEVVASRSSRTAAVLKDVVYRGLDADLATGLEIERLAIIDILNSPDYREGLAAFTEKRAPDFG